MFLKVAIVPAEATADGFKHFRLITSVHASLFITVYLSLCWKMFLNATDSGKIAYSTNQNREMKENILRYIFNCMPQGSISHFLGFGLFTRQIFSSNSIYISENANIPYKNGFSKNYII